MNDPTGYRGPVTKLDPAKLPPRTPEQEARLEEFHQKIGQALVDNLNRNVMRETSEDATSQILRAAAFAADRHRDQRRKGADASPYINHPLALANLLSECGERDPTVLVAALLHDTVEDTGTTLTEIEQAFGRDVSQIVAEVTDDKSLPKIERKRRQIEHAKDLSQRAKLVKLADKICNLRDMHASPPVDWSLERRREYFDWARQVIDQIRGAHPRLEQLFDAAYAKRP